MDVFSFSYMDMFQALGIQHVYVIDPKDEQIKNKHKVGSKKVAKNCATWLTVQHFATISDCILALRAQGRSIWGTSDQRHTQVILCHAS
jgi:hypothetical protein